MKHAPSDEGISAVAVATRFRRAQQAGGIHLFEIGPDQVARCDDGLRSLFGLSPGEQLDHAVWFARLHPDDRDRLAADFARLMRDGGGTDIEYRVLLPDGTVRWLLSRAQLVADPERPGSVFGVTMDVTESRAKRDRLRESQRALAESEARLRAALESTTDSVFMLSADWRFTFLNHRAIAQLSGGRDLLGREVWNAFPEAVGGPLWQAYHRCMAERVPTEAEQFYPPLGRLFSARTFPADDGGITVFFRDVTDEVRAKQALAESEARLRLFVERAPAAIAMFDTDMRYLAASRRYLHDYGLDPALGSDSLIGRSHYDLFPGVPKRWREVHRRVLAGETLAAEDDAIHHSDGRTDRVRWEMTPWRHADGSVGGTLLFSEVVTARVAAERALAESEARFRAAVQAVSGIVWTNDAQGRMVGEQPGWAALTGQSREEYEGLGWSRAIHPEDVQPSIDAWTRAIARRETFVFEHRVRRRDGAWRRFSIRAIPALREDGSVREWVGVHTDITDQRKAEAALAESGERLRLALDAGRMGLWSWDLATGRLSWDTQQFGLFGLDPARGELALAEGMALVHPEDRPGLEAAIRSALATGDGIYQCEFRVPLSGGTTRWIAGYGRAVPGPDGRAAGMVGLNFDVTERREAEAALAASNEAARLAAERVQLALDAGAIIGTWVWELPTDRLTGDERFARSFGLDPEHCRRGLGLEQVAASVHPEDRPRLMEAIAEAVARGGPYRCEYRVRRADGAYHWVEANGRVDLAPDGTPLRFPGVLLDIEERRAMEAERDRATALLRTFAEAVPGVVYAKDREGRMLLANEGTAALIGKRPEEFIGRTDVEFLDDKRQAEVVIANDRRIMESGIAEQVEEEVSLPDGTPVLWLSTKSPLRNAAGEVVGLVGTSVDITERKRAEAVLARGKAELERLVEERTRDLQETQARLAHAQRMEALGQLAGGIAHDFNNVLQAVQGGAGLIERRSTNPEVVRRLARMVIEATERGTSITRRLLAFSRRGELRAEPLDPAGLLRSMQEILAHTLGAGIEVRVEAAALPPLLADKGQLETVLVNLATNARDAMEGIGTLIMTAAEEIRTQDGRDRPAALRPGSYLRLSVSDTGRGMDAATLSRASEPFFTTKGPGKGTGLGLAMARGFAEQSGGGLHIESAPGYGTTVTLWFPVADATSAPPATPEGTVPPARAERSHVLPVDDEDLVREVLAQQLADRGYEVVQAQAGDTALALLDAGEPVELIVSDLSMPGMNGVALIREAQRRRPGLPAILLTGYAGDAAELAATGAADGAFSLLRKPVPGRQLAECITRLLEAPPPC